MFLSPDAILSQMNLFHIPHPPNYFFLQIYFNNISCSCLCVLNSFFLAGPVTFCINFLSLPYTQYNYLLIFQLIILIFWKEYKFQRPPFSNTVKSHSTSDIHSSRILHSVAGCLLPSVSRPYSDLIFKGQMSNDGIGHLTLEHEELHIIFSIANTMFTTVNSWHQHLKNTNKDYIHIQLLAQSPNTNAFSDNQWVAVEMETCI